MVVKMTLDNSQSLLDIRQRWRLTDIRDILPKLVRQAPARFFNELIELIHTITRSTKLLDALPHLVSSMF